MAKDDAKARRKADLKTPSDLSNAAQDIAGALNACLADTFALYLKTKNFHWHMSGPHFRDYHLLCDEQAAQILRRDRRHGRAGAQDRRHHDPLDRAYRAGCSGCSTTTPTSSRPRTCSPSSATTTRRWSSGCARRTALCDEANDVATASLIENWIDEAERRVWFLFEATRRA